MGTPDHPRPAASELLADVDAATDRLLEVASTLGDEDVRGPSRLPGWSRGHVLTHLARNADGLVNLLTWAGTGVVTPMYASAEARSADIEAGAGRGPSELLADVQASAAGFRDHLTAFPESAADVEVAMLSGAEAYGWEIPLLRVREVEVHLVDLAAGVSVDDWSDRFATSTLAQLVPGVTARGESPVTTLESPAGERWELGGGSGALQGSPQQLLGWLMGRSDGSALTPVGRADVPAPPRWG